MFGNRFSGSANPTKPSNEPRCRVGAIGITEVNRRRRKASNEHRCRTYIHGSVFAVDGLLVLSDSTVTPQMTLLFLDFFLCLKARVNGAHTIPWDQDGMEMDDDRSGPQSTGPCWP